MSSSSSSPRRHGKGTGPEGWRWGGISVVGSGLFGPGLMSYKSGLECKAPTRDGPETKRGADPQLASSGTRGGMDPSPALALALALASTSRHGCSISQETPAELGNHHHAVAVQCSEASKASAQLHLLSRSCLSWCVLAAHAAGIIADQDRRAWNRATPSVPNALEQFDAPSPTTD